MKKISFFVLAIAFLFSVPSKALAESGNERVQTRLIVDHASLQPPDAPEKPAGRIGLILDIESGWHTYWRNSGEAAMATSVSWLLPEGWRAGELRWPAPLRFIEKGDITTYGYRNQTLLWADSFAPDVIPAEAQKVTLGAKVSFLVCKHICVPGTQTATLEIPFSTSDSLEPSKEFPLFEKYIAETPKSWNEMRKFLPFGSATFDTSLGRLPDGSLSAVLALRGFKTPDNISIADDFQVFPYKNAALIPAKAAGKIETDGVTLQLPAKTRPGNIPEWEGIVVLSSKLSALDADTAFEWKLSMNPEAAKDLGPPDGYVPLRFRVKGAEETPRPAPVSAERAGTLWGALLAAFIAGILLNLMPCVLPIISIKIMGFVSQADQSRRTVLISSLSFAAGILVSFLALALVLISLRSVGVSMGWGFQFQYPEFVAVLLLIVFFLSLALFDFYTVNLPFMQGANEAASKVHSPIARHFFDGVLATLLSTPCTAPILGTALVFAFAQPPIYTVIVFLTIGVGLALPYVYFASHPALLKRIPQPGNWMFHFRQTMGFFLLGTCAWLLFVLHDLTDKGAVWAVVLMLFLFFFLWSRKTLLESNPNRGRSLVFNFVFYGVLASTTIWLYPAVVQKRGAPAKGLIEWTAFSPAVLDDAAARNQAVFIDFTASWCITCKFNEFRMIETAATAAALKRGNVLPVKADWTSGDEEITAALKRYGAEGVPLYVVISANGGDPVVLSTLPAQSTLLDALAKASS